MFLYVQSYDGPKEHKHVGYLIKQYTDVSDGNLAVNY